MYLLRDLPNPSPLYADPPPPFLPQMQILFLPRCRPTSLDADPPPRCRSPYHSGRGTLLSCDQWCMLGSQSHCKQTNMSKHSTFPKLRSRSVISPSTRALASFHWLLRLSYFIYTKNRNTSVNSYGRFRGSHQNVNKFDSSTQKFTQSSHLLATGVRWSFLLLGMSKKYTEFLRFYVAYLDANHSLTNLATPN